MARKKTLLKSKDTRRRYTDEFKDEAVQMMLDGPKCSCHPPYSRESNDPVSFRRLDLSASWS